MFVEHQLRMRKVIKLSDGKMIPPKSETHEHAGQRYTVTYDPNAPEHERWVWHMDYVRTYPYFGSCPTLDAAQSRAMRRIVLLNKRVFDWEERE